jgi:hypothetical protein
VARKKSNTRSAQAWDLAGRQHGIVSRRDLLGLGFTRDAIDHRVTNGRLHPVARGIYAVGWPRMTRERRWFVAVLACGNKAGLSHRSAAALWEIANEHRARIDVSIRRRCKHRRPGIRAMGRPSLRDRDFTIRNGIPVTTPTRTLLDLATELDPKRLERAVNEADKRHVIDPETLRAALDEHRGEPGIRALRKLLDLHTFRLSDSELEVLFRPIAARVGLPPPLTKMKVSGFEVDFFWPDLGLVVETDGLKYHRTATAQARDHIRDQAHTAAGLVPLRFTHRQVKYERDHVRQVLEQTLKHIEWTPMHRMEV